MTQLTKDDVYIMKDRTGMFVPVILKERIKGVVEFYENYKDKDWCEELTSLWINRKLTERNWNDWLFSYCFQDGLK